MISKFYFYKKKQSLELSSHRGDNCFIKQLLAFIKIAITFIVVFSQRTLTMSVGVVALHYVVLITKYHNSHKHSQSPLTRHYYE